MPGIIIFIGRNPLEQYAHGTMAKYEAFDGSRIGLGWPMTTKHTYTLAITMQVSRSYPP